jgi:branched-chain amino acid transport system substrate-binding protein
MIGQVPIEGLDYTNPFSFPISSGAPGIFAAEASFLIKLGVKKLSIIYTNVAVAKSAADNLAAGFKALGGTAVKEVPLDTTTVDPTPAVTAATVGFNPDAISNQFGGDQCASSMKAMQAAGLQGKTKILFTASCNAPAVLRAAGSAANGVYFNGNYPDPAVAADASNPEVAAYLTTMRKYVPGVTLVGDAVDAYAVPFFMKAIIGHIPAGQPITPVNIITALKSAKNVPIPMGPTYTWDPAQASQKAVPQLAIGAAAFIQYDNGTFTQATHWINGFEK